MSNQSAIERFLKEIDENVNYDEAELGCNWSMDDLKESISKELTLAEQRGREEAIEKVVEIIDVAKKNAFPFDPAPLEVKSLTKEINSLIKKGNQTLDKI